jgi:quercetin dioxygenase-like cupin family protein
MHKMHKRKSRPLDSSHRTRDLFRAVVLWTFAVTMGAGVSARAEIRAFKLYTGPDMATHVLEGAIDQTKRTDVVAMRFSETPAHSSAGWHTSPESQYVISLSGTLEFTTRGGETFVLRPGDVLLSEDRIGSGHRWRLIDDQPWRRAYVVLKPGADDSFVAKPEGPHGR